MNNTENLVVLAKSLEGLQNKGLIDVQSFSNNEGIRNTFVAHYEKLHGGNGMGAIVFQQEMLYFSQVVSNSEDLQKSNPSDLYIEFAKLAIYGLSLATEKKLAYLLSSKNKEGKVKPYLQLSPYGYASVLRNCNQITHIEEPILVYEGDVFKSTLENGVRKIHHEQNFLRPDNAKILATYVYVVMPDGRRECKVFSRKEIEDWRSKSRQANGFAWGGGVIENAIGMVQAKTIRHALKHVSMINNNIESVAVEEEFSEYEDLVDTNAPITVVENLLEKEYHALLNSEFITYEERSRSKRFDELASPEAVIQSLRNVIDKRKLEKESTIIIPQQYGE